MTKLIELDNLTKEYNGQVVLKGIHLDINEKEFVTLLYLVVVVKQQH